MLVHKSQPISVLFPLSIPSLRAYFSNKPLFSSLTLQCVLHPPMRTAAAVVHYLLTAAGCAAPAPAPAPAPALRFLFFKPLNFSLGVYF